MRMQRISASELVSLTTTRQTLEDLIVDLRLKTALQHGIEEQSHLGEIMSHGLRPQKTFLLTGPPGCGKTMAASVITNSLNLPLFTVRLDAIITRFLGESSDKLRAVFEAHRCGDLQLETSRSARKFRQLWTFPAFHLNPGLVSIQALKRTSGRRRRTRVRDTPC